ncbi:hypothetical protein ScPMuIL_006717 [Solemya velum]
MSTTPVDACAYHDFLVSRCILLDMMASFLSSTGVVPLSHQDMLENAARLVDRQLQEDRSYPDLSELLRIPAHNQTSVSGLHDYDYPNLLEAGICLDGLPEVGNVKKVPLPPELVEQFGRMQCNCMMGLFPEIERAWLTIDSDIFVWRYEDRLDLAYFDGLSETILSAALVKPKPGIFQLHIQYLLVLATPADIVLLGVSFAQPHDGNYMDANSGAMHLLPEPLFSVPTDNTYIMEICGSRNGRIFMAGKDGCLYELAYQADDGWFSRKCRKVNHSTSTLSFLVPSFLNFSFSEDDPVVQISVDDSRHILYTRTEKGTIQVFDLGQDGKSTSRVASIALQTIVNSAANTARTIDRTNFKPIVHISALSLSESSNLHLVAVTKSGVRLYFTTNAFGNKGRPSMLSLVHIRLPPGFSSTAAANKPNDVHKAFYKKGSMLLISSQSEDNDLLWTISSDSFPFQNQLMESQSRLPVDGKTWAMTEVQHTPTQLECMRSADLAFLSKPDPPVVVTQHTEPPQKFVLLSGQGTHIFSKLRPVDQLRQLLIDCQGPDAEEVKAFFRLHKIEQACATCLILSCSRIASDQQVANWASMAFFLHGGEAQYHIGGGGMPGDRAMVPSTIGPGDMPPTQASTPMHHGLPSMYPSGMNSMSQYGQPSQEIIYSGKHNGICLYMSRILRPLWDTSVTADVPVETPQGTVIHLSSNFSSESLNCMLESMKDLSDFVDFNSRFDSAPTDSSVSALHFPSHLMGPVDEQTRRRLQNEAQKLEKVSLQQIQELIHRVEEVIGLFKVLVDHQFHTLAAALTKDQQNQLRSLTFKQLVTSGKDICGALITCLINRFLNDNATIDAISTKLRQISPSLYSSDDAICSKANELLQAAQINHNQMEKRQQLMESLRKYKEVVQPLQLQVVCNQFATVQYYDGIVDLCLCVAKKRDPQELGLHFYKSGEPPEDMQGMQAYMQRMGCYKCITETLGYLMSASISHPQAPSIPKSPGLPPAPDPGRISAVDADRYKADVFQLALKSEDELFHMALYDWLFSMNLTEKLLDIQSPFLEPYLKRKSSFQSDDIGVLDLLWKYYEKKKNFSAASRILTELSERPGTDMNLQQRIAYLSRAIMCAKSSTSRTSSATEGEFLHELEEKWRFAICLISPVACLQLQVQKALSKLNPPSLQIQAQVQEGVARLDSDLVDITKLYEEFADKFDLSECKLAIVHCAGLYDSALVENLWQSIIDREVSGTVAGAAPVRITNISNKLLQIGKLYINTERYFPTAFIVKYLEQRSCELGFDSVWFSDYF